MEGEWFRWVIGIVVTLNTSVVGAIILLQINQLRMMSNLDKRLALHEGQEHVDPISYTKVITEFSMTITALTRQMAEHITTIERKMAELSVNLKQVQTAVETQGRSR